MLELTTEEVIMNQAVVAYEESSRKDLYVAVVGDDGTLSGQGGRISLNDSLSAPIMFTLKLINPGEDIPDLQYAIETTEGATFKGGGCDGRRSLGRLRDDLGLELTIHAPDKEIRVWAGWATKHEAVKLTDELVFTPVTVQEAAKPKEKAPPNENEAEPIEKANEAEPPPNEGDALEEAHREAVEEAHKDALDTEIQVLRDEVKEIEHREQDQPQDDHGGEDLENEKKDALLKKDPVSVKRNASDTHEDVIARFKEAYQKKHMGEPKRTRPDLMHQKEVHDPDPTLSAPVKETIKKYRHDEWIRQFGKRQNEELLESQEKLIGNMKAQRPKGRLEKWTKQYTQDNDPRFDLWRYTYGVVVMVVGILSVTQLCLCIARHGKKGRRDL
jgi:hypothetical protein